MKANKYISKTENILLLIFAFLVFGFVLSVFTSQVISSYNYSISEEQSELKSQADGKPHPRFSGFNGPNVIPGLHLLTLFIFIALLKTKKFLLSSFLTVFYAIVFIYGLSARFNGRRLGGEEFSPKVDFLKQLYLEADSFDYLVFLFVSILLFWQFSILLRMLIKTLQRKNVLP